MKVIPNKYKSALALFILIRGLSNLYSRVYCPQLEHCDVIGKLIVYF